MLQFSPQSATRVGVNILIIFAAVVALRLGQTVFIPTLIALLLAAVLGPAAAWLHHKLKMSWTLACIVVIFGLVLFNLLLFTVFTLATTRMIQQLPSTDTEILDFYNTKFRPNLEQIWPYDLDPELFPLMPTKVAEIRVYEHITKAAPQIISNMAEYGVGGLFQWVIILFILLFLLLEGRMLTRRVVEVFGPTEDVRSRVGGVMVDMAQQVRTYLVWRTIINFGLAIVIGIIYWTVGLRQAWTWAILLAILNYIPYLGPLLAGIPPLLDAFLFVSPAAAIVILIVYTIIIVVEGYLIVPLVMGHTMEMNATTVMLACLFWDLVWGMMGLFLAMPIMAGVKAICNNVPGWRPWANLMGTGDEAPKPLSDPIQVMDAASHDMPPPPNDPSKNGTSDPPRK